MRAESAVQEGTGQGWKIYRTWFNGLTISLLTALSPLSGTSLGCSSQPGLQPFGTGNPCSESVASLTPLLVAAPGVADMS